MPARLILTILCVLVPTFGQEFSGTREFLTDYEIEVLRENQAMDKRISAYAKFAALRLELIEQTLEKEEAGRAAKVHRSLKEYASIIQAVDDVIDDALLRNKKLDGALSILLEAEQRFAARLAVIAGAEEADAWRYEFVLEDAIGITEDSMDLLAEDLGTRKRTVVLQEETEKQRQKERMAPERRKEVERASQQEAAEQAERKRKRPSLLRPGEKIGGDK